MATEYNVDPVVKSRIKKMIYKEGKAQKWHYSDAWGNRHVASESHG